MAPVPGPPPPSQPPSAPPPSLFPPSTVQHVAQTSLSLAPLKDNVASSLAADTEHRLRVILQDAAKFMRHGRREKLTIDDVKRALDVKGMEPVYGFLPNPSTSSTSTVRQPHFRRTMTSTGIVFHVEEEEIDLEQVAKRISSSSRAIPLRKGGAGWKAHWLAIEGVQPLIPENPTPQEIARRIEDERDGGVLSSGGHTAVDLATTTTSGAIAPAPTPSKAADASATNAQSQPLVKHILSRELQVYYQRLTEAILSGLTSPQPSDDITDATALAGLSSLRSDPGLHQLVPYLAQWVSTNITTALAMQESNAADTTDTAPSAITTRHHLLLRIIATIEGLVFNPHIGIETYIHLLLPSLLSIILISLPSTQYDPVLRIKASALLAYILRTFAPSYPSIKPRITRVLLEALYSGTTGDAKTTTTTTTTTASRDAKSQSPTDHARDGSPSASTSSNTTTPLPTKVGAVIALCHCGGGMARAVIRARAKPAVANGTTGDSSSVTDESELRFGSAFKALGDWLQTHPENTADEVKVFVEQVKLLLYQIAQQADVDQEDQEDEQGTEDLGQYWLSTIGVEDEKALRGWRAGLKQL